MRLSLITVSAFSLATAAIANAASPTPTKATPSPAPAVATTTPVSAPAAKVLWDEWYIVATGGIPSGYYNDRVEVLDGNRVSYSNQFWRKENGVTYQEGGKSFARYDKEFTPLFFNFRSSQTSEPVTVDVTAEGNVMTSRVIVGANQRPVKTRGLIKGAVFSSFYPLAALARIKELQAGKTISFAVILESDIPNDFAPILTTTKLEKPDTEAKKLGAIKIRATIGDQINFWYFDSKGIPLRIEFPQANTVVQKSTAEQAKKFIK